MGACTSNPQGEDEVVSCPGLVILTINVEQYKSFPSDEAAGARRLREITELSPSPPDVICVQEGVEDGHDILGQLCGSFGYQKLQSSAWHRLPLDPNSMITNQLYLRIGSRWESIDKGVQIISSNLILKHELGSMCLPVRTVVWTRLKPKARLAEDGPAIVLLNAHFSGGRYEDQCYLQRLAAERKRQSERILDLFQSEARSGDVGIVVGDFNSARLLGGPADEITSGYFEASIRTTRTVKNDVAAQRLSDSDTWGRFVEYMSIPFGVFADSGWTFAYDENFGPTSKFGQTIDHVAISDKNLIAVSESKRILLCNQVGNNVANTDDTQLPLTDHNAVAVSFNCDGLLKERAWYSGGPPPACETDLLIQRWAEARERRRAHDAKPVEHRKAKEDDASAGAGTGGGLKYKVLLRQAEGHPTIRVMSEPRTGAKIVAEIASGELAVCEERRGDFLRISCKDIEGWIGQKNSEVAPVGAEAGKLLGAERLLVRQAEGHPAVRVFAKPQPGSDIVGEVPSGELTLCTAYAGDFIRIEWNAINGWIAAKNARSPNTFGP